MKHVARGIAGMAKSRKGANIATQRSVQPQDLERSVAQKAYELYEQSGRVEGRDLENWLEAERCVQAQLRVENCSA